MTPSPATHDLAAAGKNRKASAEQAANLKARRSARAKFAAAAKAERVKAARIVREG
jgi:hypothetical protein